MKWIVRSVTVMIAMLSGGALAAHAAAAAPEVSFKHQVNQRQVQVHIGEEHFTTYHYNDGQVDAAYQRTPFLWPVYGEGGVGLTRNYPMADDEIDDSDHPHHRSLAFVYGDVNGADHWHSETVLTQRLETGAKDDYAFIRAHNDWLDEQGEPIVREVQELRFRGEPASARLIELVTTFHADYGDVSFNDDKEGLIATRIRPDITGSRDGVLTNADGLQGESDVYGTPAPWMDYSGPIDDHGWRGIAIFDHPDNFRPGYWHVRDYGLMALNPFARSDVGGQEDGTYELPKGQTLTLRYAWFVHSGDHEEADVAARYQQYAEQETEASHQGAEGGVIDSAERRGHGAISVEADLQVGQEVFHDRHIIVTNLPPMLRGADLVRTYNDDKQTDDVSGYRVSVSEPATLFVLVDERFDDPNQSLPWISDGSAGTVFVPQDQYLQTNDTRYQLWQAHVEPGTYELGTQSGNSMYLVAATQPQQSAEAADDEKLQALYLTGGCCHDYDSQKVIIPEGIRQRLDGHIEWTIAHEGGDSRDHKMQTLQEDNWSEPYDVVVHNTCFGNVDDARFIASIAQEHVRTQTPAIFIHCAVHSFRHQDQTEAYRDLLGARSMSHEDHRPLEVENLDPDHPVMADFPQPWNTPHGELYIIDELGPNVSVLAQAYGQDTDQMHPVIWTNDYQGVRVLVTTLGHHNETVAHDVYLNTLTRGIRWSLELLDD